MTAVAATTFRTGKQGQASRSVDGILLTLTFVLVGLGLLMVYSTTGVLSQERFHDSFYYFKRQLVASVFGFFALFFGIRLAGSPALKKYALFAYPFCLFLLLGTMIPGLGDSAGGAQRWVNFGFVRFQPGEFVKLGFIIFFASYLDRHAQTVQGFKQGVLIPLTLIASVAGLFLQQPDFGSASVVTICSLIMLIVCGLRLRYIIFSATFLLCSAAILVYISPYRMARVMSFLSPTADASGKGYQLVQSLIAVAQGGFSGVGLGNSQQKLFFLPAAHTDFIFAVISEELGFWGALATLGLFCWFVCRGVQSAIHINNDVFKFALATGLTMMIGVQALLNIGVVIGMLPTKGMVLPLVGYGGTSLVASMMGIGILLGTIRKDRRKVSI